jgi:histone acetyltransferase MYST1
VPIRGLISDRRHPLLLASDETNEMQGKVIEVGDKFLVEWKNGQKHPGEVIEIRPNKAYREAKASFDDSHPESFEYYVHYPNFDRRLDEWVPYHRIDTHTCVDFSDRDSSDHATKGKKNKRKLEEASSEAKKDDKEAKLGELEKEHDEITKVKNIQCIVLGKYEIETWYFSPYPEEYAGDDKMHICEFCLKYMKKQKTLLNHSFKCNMKSPPGKEIYRDDTLSMFEIDGKENKIYCQNLCLLSKLFLDHKTLYYDVDPFLFYVLCEMDAHGAHHIVGYFSKEKQSLENYNLACILTFPPYQRKGYGKFLMSVSYELTKREGTTGSPEKPLSDLGKISYRSYWTYVLLNIFRDRDNLPNITIQEISRMTGFKTEDILSTLHALNMIKYWKGQHVISVNQKAVENHLLQAKKVRLCDPACLTWQPPSSDRSLKSAKTI